MATKVTFNTLTKTIKFNSGVTSVDFKTEVYSDAKEDWISDSSLRKYPFPFVSIGGNEVTGGKVIEPTFFLLGGWQMEPASEDHEVTIFGNVFHDAGLALVKVPTGYSIVVNLSTTISPDTKNASIVRQASEDGLYNGVVTINTTSSYTGTEDLVGTEKYPVNNLADALLIAADKGFKRLLFKNDYTFVSGDNVALYELVGEAPARTTLTFESGSITTGTEFFNCNITGYIGAIAGMTGCHLRTIIGDSNAPGVEINMHDCIIENSVTLSSGLSGELQVIKCMSGVAGQATPTFNMNGADVDLVVRDWTGGVEMQGMTAGQVGSFDISSGQMIFNADCTSATATVRGQCKVTNNASGNVGFTLKDETTTAMLAKLLQIETGRWKIVDNQMVLYESDGITALKTFDLKDSSGNPTETEPFERVPV